MLPRLLAVAALAAVLPACSSSSSPASPTAPASTPAKSSVRFFKGTSAVTSPDGATPFGPPSDVVVRRTVDPSAGTILELVVSAGREIPTTLTRKEGTTFAATDDKKSFSGTLTFSGEDWRWDGWTYAIALTDGSGDISGKGSLRGDALQTEKLFSKGGKPTVRIRDELRETTAEEFEKERTRLLALPPPRR